MGMKEGVCTECGGEDIRTREGYLNNYAVMFAQPKIDIYVCMTCGYVAQFMQPADIEFVYDSWHAVPRARRVQKPPEDGELVDFEFRGDTDESGPRKNEE